MVSNTLNKPSVPYVTLSVAKGLVPLKIGTFALPKRDSSLRLCPPSLGTVLDRTVQCRRTKGSGQASLRSYE